MNLDKIQNDFIKESKKLVEDIKDDWWPTIITKKRILFHKINTKIIRKLRGRKFYKICLFITFILMLLCLFLYFIIPDEDPYKKIDNICGNAFAGFLTGFIVMFLGNIKKREVEFCDSEYNFYKDIIDEVIACQAKFTPLCNTKTYNFKDIYTALNDTNNLLAKLISYLNRYEFKAEWKEKYFDNDYFPSLIEELQNKILKKSDKPILTQKEFDILYSDTINKAESFLNTLKFALFNESYNLSCEKNSLENGVL